jgi:CMP/dCMP kinase
MEQQIQKLSIITLAGQPGSGKSTTSKAVASQLGYRHFSSGDMFRSIGASMGLDVLHTNLAAEKMKSIDEQVDQRLRDIGTSEHELVIDARTAWHWIPQSFKVFLDLDLEIAAQRIIKNTDAARRASEHIPDDPKEYAKILQQRLDSEARRYESFYQINPYDLHNYDLVVDTGAVSLEAVVEQIANEYKAWLGKAS